ncbi:DUF397 domain-containing protein [Streptomyces sp. AJS327]|uniref:DUF397 domain-containing protein n=1 Tax=Streptomyces sp. AJS327 TaxID=2545265 RepID=UPI0015DECC1C|nr:DUF397 domain-containing protein [Streptomyces sp. AJS327]MBA0053711.1 DUF397 domain-containing protein [Streptomyces sp. AJS327]
MNNHPATVMAPDLGGADWVKSSYSNGGGNCVEAAAPTWATHGAVAIRDSKQPNGAALLVGVHSFAAFTHALKAKSADH